MRYAVLILFLSSPAVAGEPAYTWKTHATDPDRVYLYLDGKQVGGWCYESKHYRPFDGKEWGTPTSTAPIKPPVKLSTPIVLKPLNLKSPPGVRGPFRRMGATMGQATADITLDIFSQLPGAIWEGVKKGEIQLKDIEFKVDKPKVEKK